MAFNQNLWCTFVLEVRTHFPFPCVCVCFLKLKKKKSMRIYMTKIITLSYSQENSGNYLHGLLKKKLTLVLDVVLVMTIDTLIEILCIKFMYINVVVYFILHNNNKKRKKIQKFSVYAICIVRLSVTVPMRYCACVVFNLKLQDTFVKIWIFFFLFK